MITKRTRVAEHFYNDPGSPERELYILDGDHLIVTGVEDSQAIIDSFADSTDLNNILARITEEEYFSMVNSRRVFMDTTDFPQTLADIKNYERDIVAKFNGLPEDVKKELGSVSKLSKMSDEDFANYLISKIPAPADIPVESEVNE